MNISQFDYHLPKQLIAQRLVSPRDRCRLLVMQTKKKNEHRRFSDIISYLHKGDVLVINDTKVFPARIHAKKETGGKVEVFLLKDLGNGKWQILLKHYRTAMNTPLIFPRGLQAHIIGRSDAVWTIRFNKKGKALRTVLEKIGETPTPPYITASAAAKEYQTVYAKKRGSVAAPTAGFHFTRPLMASLKKQGILFVPVTLHVGLGTFAPVKETDITLHKMHKEEAELSVGASRILNRAKKDGRRVIAVGTTATRLLESFSDARGTLRPGEKAVDLFAYPGYRFSTVDGMITNLHLPKSTLLMLVAAFIAHKDKTRGVPKKLLATYREAIKKKYRFYSFGDAMLIL